jgi:hypothetical protein
MERRSKRSDAMNGLPQNHTSLCSLCEALVLPKCVLGISFHSAIKSVDSYRSKRAAVVEILPTLRKNLA